MQFNVRLGYFYEKKAIEITKHTLYARLSLIHSLWTLPHTNVQYAWLQFSIFYIQFAVFLLLIFIFFPFPSSACTFYFQCLSYIGLPWFQGWHLCFNQVLREYIPSMNFHFPLMPFNKMHISKYFIYSLTFYTFRIPLPAIHIQNCHVNSE